MAAMARADSTIWRIPALERSEVCDDPTRLPTKTRSPARREPASFSVSSARIRTCAENSSPSASVHSASVAPCSSARRTAWLASSVSIISDNSCSRAAHGHAINLDGGNPDAYRNALPLFAADAHAFVQLQVVPHHAHMFQSFRAVAGEHGAADRTRDVAIFDEIALRSAEHKIAAGDIHLAAAEVGAIQTARSGTDDVGRIAIAGEHKCVRHARHGNVLVVFATPASRGS